MEYLYIIWFRNGNDDSEGKYESCSYYDFDYESLVLNSKGNYKAALDYIKAINGSKNGEKKNCDRWVYDDSIYSSTIVTQVHTILPKLLTYLNVLQYLVTV
jgi:hypothetical protein